MKMKNFSWKNSKDGIKKRLGLKSASNPKIAGIDKDRESAKADKDTLQLNYLDNTEAKREITPTTYNTNVDSSWKFSDPKNPKTTVNTTLPDGLYKRALASLNKNQIPPSPPEPPANDLPADSYSERDLWSTKDTPTAKKFRQRMPGDARWNRPAGPSTMVTNAMYNPNTQQLNLQFRNKDGTPGKIFPYYDVSPEEVESMVFAPSIGQNIVNGNFYKGHGTTKADEISDINQGM